MSESNGKMSVAEAAARLGVSERTVYRLLKSSNYDGRTLTEQRQTATGRRLTTVLPADVLEELDAHFKGEQTAANNGDRTVTNAGNDADNNDGKALTDGDNGGAVAVLGDARLVTLYERQLRDKDEEIAFLREQLALAQENLAREQHLRALSPPQSAPQEAPGGPQSGGRDEGGEPGHAEDCEPQEAGPRRAWWLFWKRREKI